MARCGPERWPPGAEKSKFDAMMTNKVMPAMADMFDQEVLLAAEAFAK